MALAVNELSFAAVGEPGSAISHMPRPCVATRRMRKLGCIAMSNTAERGSPVPNTVQLAPESVDLKTPMSEPAYKTDIPGCVGSFASTANALTGMLERPVPVLPIEVQVGGAPLRFVVLQTLPAVAGLV